MEGEEHLRRPAKSNALARERRWKKHAEQLRMRRARVEFLIDVIVRLRWLGRNIEHAEMDLHRAVIDLAEHATEWWSRQRGEVELRRQGASECR